MPKTPGDDLERLARDLNNACEYAEGLGDELLNSWLMAVELGAAKLEDGVRAAHRRGDEGSVVYYRHALAAARALAEFGQTDPTLTRLIGRRKRRDRE